MGYRRKRCTAFECSTPRAIVSRWLLCLKGGKEREEGSENGNERRRRRSKYGVGEELRINCSTKCLSEELAVSGQSKNDATFNLGAGFGLAFLIASSKSELNKMMELRAQMESLLQNAKDELQSVDKVSTSRKTIDYSTTEVDESINSNGYFSHSPSEKLLPLEFHNHELQHGRNRQGRKEMEIELESELKHLQLLCESEGHQDPGQSSIQEHEGVPPDELALRLHEVLEARQEERIKELEAALHQALEKLDEKETEASWWKETAQLFSQRLPQVPNPTCRLKSVLQAPPKRCIRLAEKLSGEVLMKS